MGSTGIPPHISSFFSCLFHNWNLGSTCTPLNYDLGPVKLTVKIILFNLWNAG